jgi:hypothetical protein
MREGRIAPRGTVRFKVIRRGRQSWIRGLVDVLRRFMR